MCIRDRINVGILQKMAQALPGDEPAKGEEIDEVDEKLAGDMDDLYQNYLFLKECHEWPPAGVYINYAQLQQAKTAMRALDDKAKQAGFDTEAAWNRSVQAYESGHGQMFSLARMMGKTTEFNPEFQRGCHLALEGLKISAQGASGGRRKKDF